MFPILPFLVTVLLQETAPAAPAPPASPASAPDSMRVETLRQRIHGMRMDLLLGGERVRQAENDAEQFYRGKIEVIDKRLDTIAAELAERRAGYRMSLQRALQAESEDQRTTALREAAAQRAQVSSLEGEEGELGQRSDRITKLIGAVDARGRERERLAAEIEGSTGFEETLTLPLGGIGLAPEVAAAPASSPMEDDVLIQDLLALDPRAARRLLFESDPDGYWRRFPLHPPGEVLRGVLAFPPSDLPGQR